MPFRRANITIFAGGTPPTPQTKQAPSGKRDGGADLTTSSPAE